MSDSLGAACISFDSRISLLAPQVILPTEDYIEERVLQVAQEIIKEGVWIEPILVERRSLIIMDGHHRREFARRYLLAVVPCLLLDYSEVVLTSRKAGIHISPDEVILRGLQHRPYPAKTTRHVVNAGSLLGCRYSLSELSSYNTDIART